MNLKQNSESASPLNFRWLPDLEPGHMMRTQTSYHSWDTANLEPSKTFSMRYKISNKFCNSENLFEMITF